MSTNNSVYNKKHIFFKVSVLGYQREDRVNDEQLEKYQM